MMRDMTEDEFAEFETTEAEIDAMMASGTPVEVTTFSFLVPAPPRPYVLVTEAPATYGSALVVANHASVAVGPVSSSGAGVAASLAA
jgi:hypothetical protein